PESLANNAPALCVNAVNLENRLRNVETDCRHRLHIELLRIVVTSPATNPMAIARQVEEPSTASRACPDTQIAGRRAHRWRATPPCRGRYRHRADAERCPPDALTFVLSRACADAARRRRLRAAK